MKKLYVALICFALLSCNLTDTSDVDYVDNNNKLLIEKIDYYEANLTTKSLEHPNRYLKIKNACAKLGERIETLNNEISTRETQSIISRITDLKNIIKKEPFPKDGLFNKIIDFRLNKWINIGHGLTKSDEFYLQTDLLQLRCEVLEAVHRRLFDGYYKIYSLSPVVQREKNGYKIFIASNDTTNSQPTLELWDSEYSDNYFYLGKKDSIISLEVTRNIGFIPDSIYSKFPNGLKGNYSLKTDRGDIDHYLFSIPLN